MSKLSFEPTECDGSPREFVGMHRPTFQDFWHNAQTWSICEKYGLPYAGGWAQHSSVLIKMLQVFDLAKAKIEREQVEEQNKSSGRRIRR